MMKWIDRWRDLHWTLVRASWERRDVRDGLFLLALAGIAYLFAHVFALPRRISTLALTYQHWGIDDVLFVGLVLSVAGPIYGIRRYRDFTREMAARLDAEREARLLSGHDHLTGLPNASFYAQRLDERLVAMTEGDRLAILAIDINGFKRVLDLYGHAAGDKILIGFAERVAALLRDGAILARTGGDAFALVIPIDALDEPAALARRIVIATSQAFFVADTAAYIGVGIGIAIAPNDGMTSTDLTRHAERALYRAKRDDRSSIRFFESDMDAHIDQRIAVEGRLRKAVANDDIATYYQPIVSLDDDAIVGFEALARWNDDVLGEVPPEVFIPLAEEIGLIGKLGEQLFRRACADASQWPGYLFMAFNVSAIQLRETDLASRILAVLEENGLSPPRLEIEITESALVDHVDEARFIMEQLRGHGVHIVLDDFGTGYATLAQLLSFPLDKIKIDRRFIMNVVHDHDSLVVVRSIIGLANGFGLASVAEGIENAEQLSCLKRNGCTQGQGYLFGQAVPTAGVPALVKKHPSRPPARSRALPARDGTETMMDSPWR
ncbi:diguanylate cyclase (GGDEF)-like protein [Luteibacter sp. W1I16]|uniref:putative bifunctional diguanylate cyclase/phosphodiesterase n=1 Tax=Luteibacter sp. W1I16 TaxID=3373922 RepID=UPI003D1E61F6